GVTVDRLLLLATFVVAFFTMRSASAAVQDARAFHREAERDAEHARLLNVQRAAYLLVWRAQAMVGVQVKEAQHELEAALTMVEEPLPKARHVAGMSLEREYSEGSLVGPANEAIDEIRAVIASRSRYQGRA